MENNGYYDDDEPYYEEESYDREEDGDQSNQTRMDHGGQYHLRSALLEVHPEVGVLQRRSKFKERMEELIIKMFPGAEVSSDQIRLFSSMMWWIEQEPKTFIGEDVLKLSKDLIDGEMNLLKTTLGLTVTVDVFFNELISRNRFRSKYHKVHRVFQALLHCFNTLLSNNLGDKKLSLDSIKATYGGNYELCNDNRVVKYSQLPGFYIVITREIVGWKDKHSPTLFLTTSDMLMNLSDKVTERQNIMLMSQIGEMCSPHAYPRVFKIEDIITWGDNVIRNLGNEGYKVLSNFEGLIVSLIIKKEDNSDEGMKFYNNIINEVSELGEESREYFDRLIEEVKDEPVAHLSQIHGLYRIWGHPIVNMVSGMTKVSRMLHKVKDACPVLERASNMSFREVFMTNYFNLHKHYPSAIWDEEEAARLAVDDPDGYLGYKYISRQVTIEEGVNLMHRRYCLRGWGPLILQQNFPLPSNLNLASFLKDRAVSPNREELIHMIVSKGRVTDPFIRRGVLKWLREQPADIRAFLRSINEESLRRLYCTIGLYPKERELKNDARMFALMSYQMRMYFVATEEMLSDHILKYFPQIAMKDNYLDILKKFLMYTKRNYENDSEIVFFVNIDFSKWNQQMRREITQSTFTDLGRLFGLSNLYNRTYDIFESSYVYLCNGSFLPQVIGNELIPEDPLAWEGDIGGKEGLRQKGWTISTAMDLYTLCNEHSFKFNIIGGGDNQVLIIKMRNLQEGNREDNLRVAKDRMNVFLLDLSEKMNQRGLPLKIGETWVSSHLFAYNKYLIYRGVQLPSTLKLAGRCFALSNSDLMTMENMTNTLNVTYQSIISKDYSFLAGWVFSRINMFMNLCEIWEYHPLLQKPIWMALKGEVNLRDSNSKRRFKTGADKSSYLLILATYPRSLGGIFSLSFFSFMIRGFPDPVSEAITYLTGVQPKRGSLLEKVLAKIKRVRMSDIRSYEKLIEDPTSLNLLTPDHGAGALRKEAEKFLSGSDQIENRYFLNMVKTYQSSSKIEFINALTSAGTLIPRELHDIMGSTLYGYISSLLSKIDKSTTINKLGKNFNVVRTIREKETNLCNYIDYLFVDESGDMLTGCPTEQASALRERSWSKRVIGVTTPHPFAFLRHHPKNFYHRCDGNYIKSINWGVYQGTLSRAGPCSPYIGSYTKEKSQGTEMMSAYGQDDILKRPIHLQKLINWRYGPESTMGRIIKGTMAAVSDIDPSIFEPDPRCIVGDAEHRYKDKAVKHGGLLNNLYHWPTYMTIFTDSFVKHSKGSHNESLHFQSCMVMISSLFSVIVDGKANNILFCNDMATGTSLEGHWHEWCSKCIKLIENPKDSETAPLIPVRLPMDSRNPYLYVNREAVQIPYHEEKKILRIRSMQLSDSITTRGAPITMVSWMIGLKIGEMMYGGNKKILGSDSAIRLLLPKLNILTVLGVLGRYINIREAMMSFLSDDGLLQTFNPMVSCFKKLKKIIPLVSVLLHSNDNQERVLLEYGSTMGDAKILEHHDVMTKQLIIQAIILNRLPTEIPNTGAKMRDDELSKTECVVRKLLGLDIARFPSCRLCLGALKDHLFDREQDTPLCGHTNLRSALTRQFLVFPETTESVSKMVESTMNNKRGTFYRGDNIEFVEYHIGPEIEMTNILSSPIEKAPRLAGGRIFQGVWLVSYIIQHRGSYTGGLHVVDVYSGTLVKMLNDAGLSGQVAISILHFSDDGATRLGWREKSGHPDIYTLEEAILEPPYTTLIPIIDMNMVPTILSHCAKTANKFIMSFVILEKNLRFLIEYLSGLMYNMRISLSERTGTVVYMMVSGVPRVNIKATYSPLYLDRFVEFINSTGRDELQARARYSTWFCGETWKTTNGPYHELISLGVLKITDRPETMGVLVQISNNGWIKGRSVQRRQRILAEKWSLALLVSGLDPNTRDALRGEKMSVLSTSSLVYSDTGTTIDDDVVETSLFINDVFHPIGKAILEIGRATINIRWKRTRLEH